jgi:hypothetical protein
MAGERLMLAPDNIGLRYGDFIMRVPATLRNGTNVHNRPFWDRDTQLATRERTSRSRRGCGG